MPASGLDSASPAASIPDFMTREHGMPRRSALLALLSVLIGLFVPLLLAEIVLRFLPVNTGLATQAVTASDPILHYRARQSFTYSNDWRFSVVNRGWVNGAGLVNNQEYDTTATTPLLGIIGDSYVEALMVPYDSTIHGRLAALLGPRARVYSFGASGAPMSQYLAVAGFIRHRYRPAGLVIIVVGNDFDESLLRYKTSPGFHYFRERGPSLELTRIDYHPSTLRRLLRLSAISRYLFSNLKITEAPARIREALSPSAPRTFAGNTTAQVDSVKLALSKRVVDAFLRAVPDSAGLPAERIEIVVDGTRVYADSLREPARTSYFGMMREYLIAAGTRAGFRMIDLEPQFEARHQRDGSRFEFATDNHWNAIGHAEAALAVERSGLIEELLGSDSASRR
jgi:hypothetical protein